MRKNRTIKRGKNFAAFGWGKRGPYLTVTRRVRHRTYAKASFGSMGPQVGMKYSGRKGSVQGLINPATGKPSFTLKRKRR